MSIAHCKKKKKNTVRFGAKQNRFANLSHDILRNAQFRLEINTNYQVRLLCNFLNIYYKSAFCIANQCCMKLKKCKYFHIAIFFPNICHFYRSQNYFSNRFFLRVCANFHKRSSILGSSCNSAIKDDSIDTRARSYRKASLDLHNIEHVASRSRGRIPGNRRLFLGINP